MSDSPSIRETSVVEQFGGRRVNLEVAGRPGFVLTPHDRASDAPASWMWYAPHFDGVMPRDPLHKWICTRLLDAGMAIAGVDVGESYGSPEGRRIYTEFHRALVGAYHLAGRARLLAQSRGGLMHYNWAVEHPSCVERIAAIYPVCNLADWPGAEKAAPAYGLTPEQMQAQLPQHNPIERLAPLAAANIPILHLHGDCDSVIPLEKHSGEFARRYQALGGPIELVVVPGAEHEEIDAFFTSQKLVDFLTQ